MEIKTNKTETLLAELEQLRQKISSLEAQKEFMPTNNAFSAEIFENNPMSLQIVDKHGYTLQVNAAHTKLFGAVPPADYTVFDDPLVKKQGLSGLFDIAKSGKTVNFPDFQYNIHELIPTFPDVPVWIKMVVFPIPGSEGQPERFVLMHEDITAHKQAEEMLRKSEENLRVTLDSIGDAVITTDLLGNVVQMNPVALKLTGWSLQNAKGKPLDEIFRIINADTRQKVENPVNQVLQHSQNADLTSPTLLVSHDGNEYRISDSAAPIRDSANNIIGVVLVFRDVTAEFGLQQEIRFSEEALRTFIENSLMAVSITNEDGIIEIWNQASENMTGIPKSEAIGKPFCDVLFQMSSPEKRTPEYYQIIKNELYGGLKTGEVSFKGLREITFVHKNGSQVNTRQLIIPIKTKRGYRFGTIADDITNHKKTEELIRKSEERFKRLIENSPDIVYSFSTTSGGSYHSPRVFDVLGYTPEQLKEQPMLWQNSVHPDDLEMVVKSVAATAEGNPINMEYRLRTASGEWRWLHDRSIHLHKNINGEILIEGLATDITDRKLAEEKLLKSEQGNKYMQELFRNMADIMPDMLWAKDLNKNFIFVNNSICQNLLNAKDTTEPLGKNDMFFAMRERQSQPQNPHWHTFGEICRDSDAIVLETGKTGNFEEFGNVKGKFLFLDVIKTPLRNDKGEIIGVVGAARDVTHSKQAEIKLRESGANLKAIIENSMESIWSVNTNYEIQYINAVFANSFHQTFGIKLMQGMNIIDVLPDSLQQKWRERYNKAFNNEQFVFQDKIETANGDIYINVAMNPIVVDGQVVGVSIFAKDITTQKLVEQKMVQAKEKAEDGDRLKTAFIQNISHEIRTPLNGILGFGQVLAESDLPAKERLEYFKILQENSNRLLQTITDYMDISMIASGNLEVNKSNFLLNNFLMDLLRKTKNISTKKHIEIILQVPENTDTMQLNSDRELIRKALGHLLGNAEKFSQKGTISFGYTIKNQMPEFFVKDTGIGIPKDKLEVIFDVFMQGDTSITRGYEGSGLGLSIVKGNIALLGGEIRAESEPNQGSVFYFTLPDVITDSEAKTGFSPLPGQGAESKPVALIAEDDKSNYFYLKMTLEKSGFDTFHAVNGLEVVEICRQHPEICLLLMDVKMPVMNGIEATIIVREFRPDLPIIALSAYAQSGDEHHILEAGCSDFLPKPVIREELLEKIAKFVTIPKT